jgi:hypothetical protein
MLALQRAIDEEESERLAQQLQNDLYSGNEEAIAAAMGGAQQRQPEQLVEEPRYNQEVYYDQMVGGPSQPARGGGARRAGPSPPV